jgi:septum formation protein
MKSLFLASQSPRRAQLLSQLGLKFQILTPSSEERIVVGKTEEEIIKQTEQNTLLKAESVLDSVNEGVIISGDTVVVTQDFRVLGKPTTSDEALVMLEQLVGTRHRVLSAVAVVANDQSRVTVDHVWTTVTFRETQQEALKRYIATKEPFGKAGGYAIQSKGAFLVAKLTGSPTAVIGLPLELVVSLLHAHGVEVWQYWKD